MVGRRVEMFGDLLEAPGKARPYRAVAATDRVQVPAIATAGVPDGAVHTAENLLVEMILCFALDLEAVHVEYIKLAQGVEDIIDLRSSNYGQGRCWVP